MGNLGAFARSKGTDEFSEITGSTSLLLLAASDATDSPPLMMLSDRLGDRVSDRVLINGAMEPQALARSLIEELQGDDFQPETAALNSLITRMTGWIIENRLLGVLGGPASESMAGM